jgi:hypothetical protein
MSNVGAIINVKSFNLNKQPHIKTLFDERRLWGFSEEYRDEWMHLEEGVRVLLYGDGGIRMAARIESKRESYEPVKEWVKNPRGYPLQVTLELLNENVDAVRPIDGMELIEKYGIREARTGFQGFSLVLFGEGGKYPLDTFNKIWEEFLRRNDLKDIPKQKEGIRSMVLINLGIRKISRTGGSYLVSLPKDIMKNWEYAAVTVERMSDDELILKLKRIKVEGKLDSTGY